MDSIEKISRICLVAADQSYWAEIPRNTTLAPYLDSGADGDRYPNSMPATFYDPVYTGLSEWRVYLRIDDTSTGFGATIYRRGSASSKADFMVALQGTRGPSAQDWGGNLVMCPRNNW